MTIQQGFSAGEGVAKDLAGIAANLPTNAVTTAATEINNLLSLAKSSVDNILQVGAQADAGAQSVVNTAAGDLAGQVTQLASHIDQMVTTLKGLAAKGQAS